MSDPITRLSVLPEGLRRFRLALLAAISFALASCGPDPITTPELGTVSGVVFFDRDHDGSPSLGEALSNVILEFGGETVTSGGDGTYTITIESGNYVISFPSLADTLRATSDFTVEVESGGAITQDIELSVVRVEEGFALLVTTTFLDSATIAAATVLDGGTTITAAAGGTLDQLATGDILVAGITDATPSGLLRRVQASQLTGGQVTLSTVPATLAEAIVEGDFIIRTPLTPDDLESVSGPAGVYLSPAPQGSPEGAFFVSVDNVLFDEDGNANTTDDQIRVDGSLTFELTILLEGSFKEFQLQSAKAGLEISLVSELSLTWSYPGTIGREIVLKEFHFTPQSIDGIFWFFPSIEIRVGVEGGVSAEVTAHMDYSAEGILAVELQEGTWNGIAEWSDQVTGGLDPGLQQAHAAAYLRMPFRYELYGIVGPTVGLKFYLEGLVDPTADPWWEVAYGVTAEAGFELEVFDRVLAGVQFDLFDVREIILEAEGPATGNLSVSITGLGGVQGDVAVTGPNGFGVNLTATTTLTGLTPGAYTITAQSVSSGGDTYSPAPTTQAAAVTANATASASVVYTVVAEVGADLTITSISPDPVVAGNTITIFYRVENTGNVAFDFGVGHEIWRGSTLMVTLPDRQMGSLEPGITRPTTNSYSIPSGWPSGSYFVRVAVWEGAAGPPSRQLDTVDRSFTVN